MLVLFVQTIYHLKLTFSEGLWTSWSVWSDCSQVCGTGFQEQQRNCTTGRLANGSSSCIGPDAVEQDCNTTPCSKYFSGKLFVSYFIQISKKTVVIFIKL
jgi:hypothetical protein